MVYLLFSSDNIFDLAAGIQHGNYLLHRLSGHGVCFFSIFRIKILAEGMGKKLVILHMAFESVLQSVQSGESDIAIAGLTINAERAQQVDFSDPYYDTTQRIAVAADNTMFDACETEEDVVAVLQSLEGVTAGAAKTQTGYYYLVGEESFEFEGYANIETRPYPTVTAAVQDLANGTITLVCADAVPLQAAVDAANR